MQGVSLDLPYTFWPYCARFLPDARLLSEAKLLLDAACVISDCGEPALVQAKERHSAYSSSTHNSCLVFLIGWPYSSKPASTSCCIVSRLRQRLSSVQSRLRKQLTHRASTARSLRVFLIGWPYSSMPIATSCCIVSRLRQTQLSAVALAVILDSPCFCCKIVPSLLDWLAILAHTDFSQLLHRFVSATDSAQYSRACSNT